MILCQNTIADVTTITLTIALMNTIMIVAEHNHDEGEVIYLTL